MSCPPALNLDSQSLKLLQSWWSWTPGRSGCRVGVYQKKEGSRGLSENREKRMIELGEKRSHGG
eukprot:1696749-Rhodomonas_salina.3